MSAPSKIILHSLQGYRADLQPLVADWIREGVKYVGVVGVDAAEIEEAIDELCVGDGSNPYFMLTASHGPSETLADAVFLAEQLSAGLDSPSTVVEF